MNESKTYDENSHFVVTFPNGSKWAVPVGVIAENRIQTYVEDERNTKSHKELYAETWELFQDEDEIADWAQNNMDWKDMKEAECVLDPSPPDYESEWPNVEWEVER
jgi:hypothetical protein